MSEITGSREEGRRQACVVKVGLLGLESTVVTSIVTMFGSLLPESFDGTLFLLFVALPSLPGAILLVASAVARAWGRWTLLDFLAEVPYASVLTLLPLALTLGSLAGILAGVKDRPSLQLLLVLVGMGGFQATLLAVVWTFLLTLYSGVPERSTAGVVAWFMSFVLVLMFSPFLANPTVFRSFSILVALVGPLLSVTIASRWLAPFRFRDLSDRRLPAHLRVRLWGLAITAILPLGGLAIPAWIRMRHRHGRELDQWAARLREPAA